MGRNKHCIAKEISATDPTELQREKAKLGKLHHMSAEASAIQTFRREYQMRPFFRGRCSAEERENGEFIIDKLMKAVCKGDSCYLHDFADVLEICSGGRHVSPIESFLVALKANYERDSSDNPEAEWLSAWPFTVTELTRRCCVYTRVKYSTVAVRDAAKKIGVLYKDGRGRPRNQPIQRE